MNRLNRYVPEGYEGYVRPDYFKELDYQMMEPKEKVEKKIPFVSLDDLFRELNLFDGMTVSFHHHLRNGDDVLNMVSKEIRKTGVKDLIYAPSAIFPSYTEMVEMIKSGTIAKIYTNYINGPVADVVTEGFLNGPLVMQTHGGRPRAIACKEIEIDVAFIACPSVDVLGNGSGSGGINACGVLGYAIPDAKYAKKVVLITDHVVDSISRIDIDRGHVDYVVQVNSIGDKAGIVSGTTQVTKDPVGLRIASLASQLIDELGYIQNGFTFQTGAGGISLAVAKNVKELMKKKQVVGRFASGGITKFMVEMLEEGLFDSLYDVQCFDHAAIRSIEHNEHHVGMDASKYANPLDACIVNELDVVILGATEIDLDFNVNVTTDSHGKLMGGSGGHSDTAYGAKLTVITTPSMKARIPIIKEKLTCLTTPGDTVDVLVTERGIAINPKREDLHQMLKNSRLPIVTIDDLKEEVYAYTGIPRAHEHGEEVIGIVEYRDGTVIDSLYKKD